ncbi:MAG: hypothetical protein L3J91_06850, partial [Thermoplasmata archaeon]|nr:hypothetical protein [Thermoplasmata archaeon]
MIERARVEQALASAETHADRILYLSALLAAAIDQGVGSVIVVGGSAIEIYVSGRYVSDDIDLVAARPPAIRVLESWGFRTEGRTWFHDEWKLDVDLVRDPSGYTGSRDRTREMATPFGPVRLAAPEDLIIRRLAEAKHWQGRKTVALEQAVMLAAE